MTPSRICRRGTRSGMKANFFLNPALQKAACLAGWTVKVSGFSRISGSTISHMGTKHKQFRMADVIHKVWSTEWWLNSLSPKSSVPYKFTGTWNVCMGSIPLIWVQREFGSGILRVMKQMEDRPHAILRTLGAIAKTVCCSQPSSGTLWLPLFWPCRRCTTWTPFWRWQRVETKFSLCAPEER
jgi:hypothetical protein